MRSEISNLRCFGHWSLIIHWSLVIGHWSFAPAAEEPPKAVGHQGLGPLLGQFPALPPPPYNLKWTWKADEGDIVGIVGSTVVVDGIIYIADAKGTLHDVDLATGKSKWKYPDAGDNSGFETTPLVVNGKIYHGDLSGIFHCVGLDGKRIWTIDAESPIHSSANIHGDRILFGTDGAEILCISALDGKIHWRGKAGDRINGTPAIVDGKALVSGCDAVLRAFDIATGNEVFTAELGALAPASPACLPDRIIIGTDRGRVVAISADGKKTLWTYDKVDAGELVQSPPATADGIVVIGAHDRQLHAIDVNTGEQKWTFKTRGDVDAPPIISDGRVYFGSRDKRFYVLDL